MSKTEHLVRRGNVFYYRRRVPLHLVTTLGKKFIQFSLGTTDPKEAKKRCAVEDLKWTTRFEACVPAVAAQPNAINCITPAVLSEREITRLVQDYVARSDECNRAQSAASPPESAEQKEEIASDIEYGIGILRNPDDRRRCA